MVIVSALKIRGFSFTPKRFYFEVSYKNSSPAFSVYFYFISMMAGYSIGAASFADSP